MSGSHANKKIGLLVCKCGSNITQTIDVEHLISWASDLKLADSIASYDLLCSPKGKQWVVEYITSNKLDRLVIAACSPKMHLKTFTDCMLKAHKNYADIHMANIREQVAWVSPEKQSATQKAKAVIQAALNRIKLHEPLEQKYIECCTDIVIIGGGIAGIEAALVAANSGHTVTIIEKEPSIGGSIIKTEEVAPAMECAPCLLAPKLTAIKQHPKIRVIAMAEVLSIVGSFGNFTVTVRQHPRYIAATCTSCEACFDVCPQHVTSAFHAGLGKRKAIYTPFAGSVPSFAVIDKQACLHFSNDSCSACVDACSCKAIDFNQTHEDISLSAGALIMALGGASPDPQTIKKQYLAETHTNTDLNLYTIEEFERIAASNGPYNGQIQLRNGQKPRSMAVIHCAGSLNETGVDYCSGICCVMACKVGDLSRKQIPDIQLFNIHDRLVFSQPQTNHFFHEQQKQGTHFIRCANLNSVKVKNLESQLEVSGAGFDPLVVDMVVLATGITPCADIRTMSEHTTTPLTPQGFFATDHPLINPTGTLIDGIYTIGACSGPVDLKTAATTAFAAIGDIGIKLSEGKQLELELMPSAIDQDLCSGCKMCISTCPYSAISFDMRRKISIVNAALCKGCGTCAASCPSSAAQAKHFTNEQIAAEIEGVMHG